MTRMPWDVWTSRLEVGCSWEAHSSVHWDAAATSARVTRSMSRGSALGARRAAPSETLFVVSLTARAAKARSSSSCSTTRSRAASTACSSTPYRALTSSPRVRQREDERDKRRSRLGVVVVTALAERDVQVLLFERRAVEAVAALISDGLTTREVAEWCGVPIAEVNRLRRRARGAGDNSPEVSG